MSKKKSAETMHAAELFYCLSAAMQHDSPVMQIMLRSAKADRAARDLVAELQQDRFLRKAMEAELRKQDTGYVADT